ncbi:uncharacterized protein EI97DRAFT_430838 [Westerdykella ornata]|uniref:DUF6590 domain-containing protein n=1 Tax=Westerdykella ornata TaxID=318751 RepID=A0A6A6JVI9_WESOR|nr:uncharacterized protein EI97DRAFT_430838 [Westerdykella ornata]KAF2279828.1 hypothetical protein EI97DRAFT_430838 [Westerdykella ornata]
MASNNGWTWSEEHADWYYAMKDPFGRVIYIWSKQGAQQPPVQTPSSHVQHLSVTYQSQNRAYGAPQSGLLTNGYTGNVPDATQHSPQYRTSSAFPTLPSNNVLPPSLPHVNPFAMPPAVPENKRVPGLIEGTPQRGWVEPLDPSYKMRTGQEAHDFFVKGRVFSMLWAEAASETAARQAAPDGTVYRYQKPSHDYTPGRFPGEFVYSNIRRFVIMRVKKDAHFVYVW